MQKCDNCCFAENYKSKLQTLQNLLDKFPPYHGEGWNYTKIEVEDWLKIARDTITKEQQNRYT